MAQREPRVVGRIGRPHGVQGEVTVEVRTDSPGDRFAAGSVLGAGPGRALVVGASRPHSGRLLVAFVGVADRTGAEALRGTLLTVDAESVGGGAGDPDDFHDAQLEGLAAVGTDGRPIGTVREVVHLPGQDLLALDTPRGEVLVPFVRALVPDVDLDRGVVVVDPPEGLLEV